MENNNIKKGDTIICINIGKLTQKNTPPPLKLNGEYICQNIKICGCGNKTYDVGISHNPEEYYGCNGCTRQTFGEDIRWCALEKEDYEKLH